MNSYGESKYFLNKVSEKDYFCVKSELTDMMQKMKGNRRKIEEAIIYAEKNGAFRWEEHDNSVSQTKWNNVKEEYNFEKGKLVQNFSKIRFEKVLELLEKVLKERGKTNSKLDSSRSNTKETNSSNFEKKTTITTPRPTAYKAKQKITPVMIIVVVVVLLVIGLILKVIF